MLLHNAVPPSTLEPRASTDCFDERFSFNRCCSVAAAKLEADNPFFSIHLAPGDPYCFSGEGYTYERCCRVEKSVCLFSDKALCRASNRHFFVNPNMYAVDVREHFHTLKKSGEHGLADYYARFDHVYRNPVMRTAEYALAESWREVAEAVVAVSTGVFNLSNPYTVAQMLETNTVRNRSMHACTSTLDGSNYLPIFRRLEFAGVNMTRSFVNVGAADGRWQDPLFDFLTSSTSVGARGVAVEGAPQSCRAYKRTWSSGNFSVVCRTLSSDSVGNVDSVGQLVADALRNLFRDQEFLSGSLALDVLKIDVDATDCDIARRWLQKQPSMRAKVLIVEAHPLPPPFKFELLDFDDLDTLSLPWDQLKNFNRFRIHMGLFGCSLSAWVAILKPFGYRLLSFLHKDASFVHISILRQAFPESQMPNGEWGSSEFSCYDRAVIDSSALAPPMLRSWFFSDDPYASLVEIEAELQNLIAVFTRLGGVAPKFSLTL